jgi:uncharacterized secreted protein with C-terminal beta-propeller domain
MPSNNPLVPVDLSSIKKRRLFGFSGHPGHRNYLEVIKEDRGLLLPIGAYTAVMAAAVFRTLP